MEPTHAPISARVRGLAYASAVVMLFSGFVLVSRFGLSTTLTIPDIAALRFGIGGLLLLPVLVKRGLSGLRVAEAVVLAILGGLGFALFAYAGFALAPAAHGAVLIHGTLWLTTTMLLWLFVGGKVQKRQKFGLIAILLGIVAMAGDGLRDTSSTLLVGDLCLLLASLCWSSYGLYVKKVGLSSVHAAAIVAVLSAGMFLPVYAVLPGKMLPHADWYDLLVQGIFQGVLIGAMSVFVYTRAITLLGSEEVALLTASVPVLTMLGGSLLLGESPSVAALLGGGLATLGMAIGRRRPV